LCFHLLIYDARNHETEIFKHITISPCRLLTLAIPNDRFLFRTKNAAVETAPQNNRNRTKNIRSL